MKNAAKCDTYCELQNSVNHQTFERKWRFQLPAGSTLPPVAPPPPSGALRALGPWPLLSYSLLISRAPAQVATAGWVRASVRELCARVPSRCANTLSFEAFHRLVRGSRWDVSFSLRTRDITNGVLALRSEPSPFLPPWSDVRPPAELKHITKRRRRKQP